MSQLQFSGLLVVWLLSTLFIATLTWFEFRRVRFNFNVFFSLLFLLTFFFGFPNNGACNDMPRFLLRTGYEL